MIGSLKNTGINNNQYLIANQTGIKTRETQTSFDIKENEPKKLDPEVLNKHLTATKDFYTKDTNDFTSMESAKNADNTGNKDMENLNLTGNVNDPGTPQEIRDFAGKEDLEGNVAYSKKDNVLTLVDNGRENASCLEENYFDGKSHEGVMRGGEPDKPTNYYYCATPTDDPDHVELMGTGEGKYGKKWKAHVYRTEGPDGKITYNTVMGSNKPDPAFSANVNMKYDAGTVDDPKTPSDIKNLAHEDMEGKIAYYKSGNVVTVMDNACDNPSKLPEENYFDGKQHEAVMKGSDPNNPIHYNYIVQPDPKDPEHVTLYGEGTGTYGTGWDGDVYRVVDHDGKVSYKSVIRMNNRREAIVTGNSTVSDDGVKRDINCYRLGSMDCSEAYNMDGTFNRDWL